MYTPTQSRAAKEDRESGWEHTLSLDLAWRKQNYLLEYVHYTLMLFQEEAGKVNSSLFP